MSPETTTERPSTPRELYNPITDPAKAVAKLRALSTKATIADQDLFEAIADTFATMATVDFEAVIVYEDGSRAREWSETDEIDFSTKNSGKVYASYWRESRVNHNEEENSWIETNDGTTYFHRKADGSVKAVKYMSDDKSDLDPGDERMERYQIPDENKRIIVETLLEGIASKTSL